MKRAPNLAPGPQSRARTSTKLDPCVASRLANTAPGPQLKTEHFRRVACDAVTDKLANTSAGAQHKTELFRGAACDGVTDKLANAAASAQLKTELCHGAVSDSTTEKLAYAAACPRFEPKRLRTAACDADTDKLCRGAACDPATAELSRGAVRPPRDTRWNTTPVRNKLVKLTAAAPRDARTHSEASFLRGELRNPSRACRSVLFLSTVTTRTFTCTLWPALAALGLTLGCSESEEAAFGAGPATMTPQPSPGAGPVGPQTSLPTIPNDAGNHAGADSGATLFPDGGDTPSFDSGATNEDAGVAASDAGAVLFRSLESLLVDDLTAPGEAGYDLLEALPSLAVNAVPSPCGGAITDGQLVKFTPDSDGTLELRVDSQGPHTALLQANCGVLNTTKDCHQATGSSALKVALLAGEPACLVIGFNDSATAQVKLTAPACGDDVLNAATEECDFGDLSPGDGCDAACNLETPAEGAGDSCPGQSATLDTQLSLTGHTVGYSDGAPATCGALPGGKDRHYAIVPAENGTVTVSLSAEFDGALSVFTGCSEDRLLSDVLACSDSPLSSAVERVTFAAERLQLYYVVVDDYSPPDTGAFQLDVELERDP